MNHKIFADGISKELIALVERVVDFFIFCDKSASSLIIISLYLKELDHHYGKISVYLLEEVDISLLWV